jgi:hypothetical protein
MLDDGGELKRLQRNTPLVVPLPVPRSGTSCPATQVGQQGLGM